MSKKNMGGRSQQQNDFLQPYTPLTVTVADIGTDRPYLATAVTSVPAAGTGAGVTVSWTMDVNSPAATSYSVSTTPTTYTKTGITSLSTTFEGLASGVDYTFTVVAVNASGSSAGKTSSSIKATTVPATPSAPTATSTVADKDNVTWAAPADGGKAITQYDWQCDDGKSGNTTSTSITVTQEGSGTSTNKYRVLAKNANGSSQWSAYSNAIDTQAPYFPFFPPFFPPYFPFFPFFPPYFPGFGPFFPPFFPFFGFYSFQESEEE